MCCKHVGWVGGDIIHEVANLDGLPGIACMGFFSQERVTGDCPPNDFATWKVASCQDLVIIMVIPRAAWSGCPWYPRAASEPLSRDLIHRHLQINGRRFSQVGAAGTREAFRQGKGFLQSINSPWIKERIIWIHFTMSLKVPPFSKAEAQKLSPGKPWRLNSTEINLDSIWTCEPLFRSAGCLGLLVLEGVGVSSTVEASETWGFRMLGFVLRGCILNQGGKSGNT